MAAGFISKTLSTLLSTIARWVEFGDGTTSPVHGAVVLDPSTGLPSVVGYGSFEEFLAREGELATWTNSAGPITVATGGGNTGLATAQGPSLVGKAVYIQEVTASLSSPGVGQIQIAASADGRFAGYVRQVVMGASGVSIAVRQIIRAFMVSTSNVLLNVRNNMTAGSVDYYGAVSASGWRITDDLDFDAPKVVMFVSDSTMNGTGPTKTATMWPFLFKKRLRELGTRARICLKSVSGATSADHEGWRAAGYHDIARADLIVYAVGINDAGDAVSDSAFVANLTAFWQWASKRYPKAKVVICGVTPLENNTSETRAAGLRTAASDYVTGVADERLKYINLGSAFDRTVSSNYAASDTPGARVHPNDTGHAAIYSTFTAAWEAFGITI